MATHNILVTGDYGFDYDIYLPSDEDNPPPDTPLARVSVSVGGAGISLRLLNAVRTQLAAGGSKVSETALGVAFTGKAGAVTAPPTVAIWRKASFGKLAKITEDEKEEVWRTKRSMSLGSISNPQLLPTVSLPDLAPSSFVPDVVLVEDNVGGYRFEVPAWLEAANLKQPENGKGAALPWIVLKTSAPVGHGSFWWALTGSSALRDRLVVVVSIKDLRHSEIRVSQGISWERTALDLARELSSSPLLEGLRLARHVIVTFHGEGVLWMQRVPGAEGAEDGRRFDLLFDPGHMEGEWSDEVCGPEGDAYGYHSAFASSVAVHLALADAGGDPADGLLVGIEQGLRTMRVLRIAGHGAVKQPEPRLPVDALALTILERDLSQFGTALTEKLPGTPPAAWERLGVFGMVAVPLEAAFDVEAGIVAGSGSTCTHQARWRILEASDHRPDPAQPLYGLGRRVAVLGLEGLKNVPYAHFGGLFTADRDEIEALRNMQRLMQEYERAEDNAKPMSIAVFGPPGAGKSFGIKQIAKTALKKTPPMLEFNLSQFDDVKDLIGAFHQVRDKVLEGGLPIVFWDEFDSQSYRWLQHLLAPMQDGKFQEGQITHPIGRCIFVFAGATCYDMAGFGPLEKPSADDTTGRQEHKQACTEFRLRKGPDFKSRLHGFLNILGPNQRQRFNPAGASGDQWEDDPLDVCFPVRRAILLRTWLGLMDPRKKDGRKLLDMDSGLLAALLEVGHYTYGARSMEKIAAAVKQDGKHGYHRSALPTDEVLDMNVKELAQFKEIMDQPRAFQQHAHRLAPAIHGAWLDLADRENVYRTEFAKLPEEAKGDNYAAAIRIPAILGLVGLQLVDGSDARPAVPNVDKILESHIELLSEEEHKGWMDVKVANGWKRAPLPKDKAEMKTQRAERRTHCLVKYAVLPDDAKNMDRTSIRNIPVVASLAQFKIVARKPLVM